MTEDWLRETLEDASKSFEFEIDKLEKLSGGYENQMFGFRVQSRRIVIRVTPPGHKSVGEVEAEIDWINYLRQNGAPVIVPLKSKNGRLVEVIETSEGAIPVSCFQWADGQRVTRDDFSESLFKSWGRAVGKLHALTKEFHPKYRNRIKWYEDEYLSRDLIPDDQTKVLKRFDSLIDYFKCLPEDRDSFGLIHQDIHHNNLFLDGKRLTVLDFDGSVYGFFVFDIANALGFSVWEKPKAMPNQEFADYYLEHFMIGYEEENQLDTSWVDHLPYALKLFEFIHYNAFNMDYDLAGHGSFESVPKPIQNILKCYRYSIEENLPYIENTFNPYA